MSDAIVCTYPLNEFARAALAWSFLDVQQKGALEPNNPFFEKFFPDKEICEQGASVVTAARLLLYVASSTHGIGVSSLLGTTWANIVKAANVHDWYVSERFGNTTAPQFGVCLLRACERAGLTDRAHWMPNNSLSLSDAIVSFVPFGQKIYSIGMLLEFTCTHICPFGEKRPLHVLETGVVCGHDSGWGYKVMAASFDGQGAVKAIPFSADRPFLVVLPHQVRTVAPVVGNYVTVLSNNDYFKTGVLERLEGSNAVVKLDCTHINAATHHCSHRDLFRSMPSHKVPGNFPTSPAETPPASPISRPSSPPRSKRARSE